jgi:hypothetical protein
LRPTELAQLGFFDPIVYLGVVIHGSTTIANTAKMSTEASDLASGAESVQFEHFIRFGPKEYKKALGLFGSNLTIFELDQRFKEKCYLPIGPSGFNNPFLVVLGGDSACENQLPLMNADRR